MSVVQPIVVAVVVVHVVVVVCLCLWIQKLLQQSLTVCVDQLTQPKVDHGRVFSSLYTVRCVREYVSVCVCVCLCVCVCVCVCVRVCISHV